MDSPTTRAWSGGNAFICGTGARTAIGLDAVATAAAVRADVSGIAVHQDFLDRADEPMHFASDALLPEDLPVPQRLAAMLGSVLDEALGSTSLTDRGVRMSCLLALPEPRIGLSLETASAAASAAFEERRLPAPRVLPRGNAAGLMALQIAAEQLASGEIDVAIVAGADSYQDRETLNALDREGWLMSGVNRNGFPPGEGAGACLLASSSSAEKLALPRLGRVRAGSTAVEPLHIRSTEGVCTGAALTAVLRDLIACLRLPEEQITATCCDLNGQRYRNEEFVYALLRTQEAFVDAHDYLCPADCWGDVGAASGLLYTALSIAGARRGYAKAARPLLWAGSESGYRSAVLLDMAVD